MTSPRNLKTIAGCPTRVVVSITAPEGSDTSLTAYVNTAGNPIAAAVQDGAVTFPPLVEGEHLYEIRCAGKPIAWGHLLARQTAYPLQPTDVVDWELAADLTATDAAQITLTLTPGPQGPQGEQGPAGPQGPQGPAANLPAASMQSWNNAALALLGTYSTPTGNSNAYGKYIVIGPTHRLRGFLRAISIQSRSSGAAQTSPFYLSIFEQPEASNTNPSSWTFRGTSSNACTEALGLARTWNFDNLELAGGRAFAICPMVSPASSWNASTQIGFRCTTITEDDDPLTSVNTSKLLPQMSFSLMLMAGELIVDLEARLAALEANQTS